MKHRNHMLLARSVREAERSLCLTGGRAESRDPRVTRGTAPLRARQRPELSLSTLVLTSERRGRSRKPPQSCLQKGPWALRKEPGTQETPSPASQGLAYSSRQDPRRKNVPHCPQEGVLLIQGPWGLGCVLLLRKSDQCCPL